MSTEVLTDRRARILRAAGRHFASTPYDKVSTVAIAEEAGVNRGWLYHEFGSKRDLYLAVLERTSHMRPLPPLTGLFDSADLEKAASAVVDQWLDSMTRARESFLALHQVHTGSHSDPVVRGVLREMNESTIDAVLATVVPDPSAASPAARALVACFGELVWQALWEWFESGRLDRAQVHAVLTTSLTALVGLVPTIVS